MAKFQLVGPDGTIFELEGPGDQQPSSSIIANAKAQMQPPRRGFLDTLGDEGSFLRQVGQTTAGAIRKTTDQLTTPGPSSGAAQGTLLGALNALTAFAPREILNQATGAEIPRGNLAGEVIGSFGVGSLANRALVKGGLKSVSRPGAFFPKISERTGKLIPKAKGVRDRAREVLTGLAASQAFRPPEGTSFFDPLERSVTGAVGILGGPVAGSLVRGFKAGKKLLTQVSKQPKFTFKDRAARISKDIAEQEATLLGKGGSIQTKLRADTDRLGRLLNEDVAASSRLAQRELVEVSKSGRATYGKRLKEASKQLDESNNPLTNQDLLDVIDDTIKEADERGLPPGSQGRQLLEEIRNRVTGAGGSIRGVSTLGRQAELPEHVLKQLQKVTSTGANKRLNLSEFLANKQEVDRLMSASGRGGSFTPNDIIVVIFNKQIGARVANKLGSKSFSETQKAYGAFIKRMDLAHDKFRFTEGATASGEGAGFIKRVAAQKSTPAAAAEAETLGRIERGGRASQGIGRDITPTTIGAKKLTVEIQRRVTRAERLEKQIRLQLSSKRLTAQKREEIFNQLARIKGGKANLGRNIYRGLRTGAQLTLVTAGLISILKGIKESR